MGRRKKSSINDIGCLVLTAGAISFFLPLLETIGIVVYYIVILGLLGLAGYAIYLVIRKLYIAIQTQREQKEVEQERLQRAEQKKDAQLKWQQVERKKEKENRLRQLRQQELAEEKRLQRQKQQQLARKQAETDRLWQLEQKRIEDEKWRQREQRRLELQKADLALEKAEQERLRQVALEKAKEKKSLQKQQIQKLETSHNYIYVKNFVVLHTYNDYSDEEIGKLHDLLTLKGSGISVIALRQCVDRAVKKDLYSKFEKSLLQCNAQNDEDIIRYFLDIYGENYQQYLTHLYYFLAQHYNISSQSETTVFVNRVRKIIIIENFEKQLLSQESNSSAKKHYDIDSMDGLEFERFLGELFTHMGYQATVTPASGDQGADLTLSKHGNKFVVQAKNYSKPVSNTAIQEVVAAIKFYKANEGMVVTNSSFTSSAIELAEANNVTLIDGNELRQMIQKYL